MGKSSADLPPYVANSSSSTLASLRSRDRLAERDIDKEHLRRYSAMPLAGFALAFERTIGHITRGVSSYDRQVRRKAGRLPGIPTAANASTIVLSSAPAINKSVSKSLALSPSRMPAWIRPRLSKSVSDPTNP